MPNPKALDFLKGVLFIFRDQGRIIKTPEEVKITEQWKPQHEELTQTAANEHFISFEGSIFENRCFLTYFFCKHPDSSEYLLRRILYNFDRITESKAASLFESLAGALIAKYGDPIENAEHLLSGTIGDLSRWIAHDSIDCIEGKTVIDLTNEPDSGTQSNLREVEIVMWQNGNGSETFLHFKDLYIDPNKKRKWLEQQAIMDL